MKDKTLCFATREETEAEIRKLGYGIAHDSWVPGRGGTWIIVTFHEGGVWSVNSDQTMTRVDEW
jgi:hypothetical protein